MKLEQMYQEIILDHYRNPHRSGLREPFDAESYQVNPTCGDEVTLRVALDGDRVTDVSYDAIGCSISQAATSVLTDLVVGRTVAESTSTMDAFMEMVQSRGQVEPDEDVLADAVAFAGVSRYPSRVKCALLGWMAFRDAVGRAGVRDAVGRAGVRDAVGRAGVRDAVGRAGGASSVNGTQRAEAQ